MPGDRRELLRAPLGLVLLCIGCSDPFPSGNAKQDLASFQRLAKTDCTSDAICGPGPQPTCMSDALSAHVVAEFSESLVPSTDPNYDQRLLFTYDGTAYEFEDSFDQLTGGENVSETHCTSGISASLETVFRCGGQAQSWTWGCN